MLQVSAPPLGLSVGLARGNLRSYYVISGLTLVLDSQGRWSPTFLTPGTDFLEDNFSRDLGLGSDGFGMIQAHYIQAHLLLCVLVPTRPRTLPVCILDVGDPCLR